MLVNRLIEHYSVIQKTARVCIMTSQSHPVVDAGGKVRQTRLDTENTEKG